MISAQDVKVFIMAGQSNMQGHGDVSPDDLPGTLSHFMNNGGAAEFGYVQNTDGSWAIRDDVWVRYNHENGDLLADKLNIGFGGDDNKLGPELGFGHLLGADTEDQILIIKTCWGGKNLAVDFRPPSSGGTTGIYYNQMMQDITSAIANIATEFPQYTGGDVKIAGFAWFQGWNDGEEQSFLDEYEQNLINLIADVRTDLNVPNLPVVVGLTGNGGRTVDQGDAWVNSLQTQLVPAQISAAEFSGHSNVVYAETRDYWIDGDASPEPDFVHHWKNNAESYLRIGTAFGQQMISLLGGSGGNNGGTSLGTIQANTNLALPSSYNFQEYVFPEPDDQGDCQGMINNTAMIDEVYIAQTHVHTLDHPLFYMIGHRPAVLQLAVSGIGAAPDVTVTGTMNGTQIGTLCLKGPVTLSSSVDQERPNFEDFFSVTLPKSWVVNGLELLVRAGSNSRTISAPELKIGPYTELNLVEVKLDVLDYNNVPGQQTVIDDQLGELASAYPASVIRYGTFPVTIPFPEFVVTNGTEQLARLTSVDDIGDAGVPNEGNINYAANDFLAAIQMANGDLVSTVYFGNTLNLSPGGWGGGRSFVSPDYDNIFVHELGHALSLPHWGEEFNNPIENNDQYLYPYGGENNEGSGIGETWTFIQDKYAFVNPKCEIESTGNVGLERSDCMDREVSCNELRGDVEGPWEGFSDFSSYSMHQFLSGGAVHRDFVPYRNGMSEFQVSEQPGYPTVSLVNGKRVFTRESTQPQDSGEEDWFDLPGEEKIEQDLYLLYGSIHPNQDQANIIYDPLKIKGNLAPSIDPTDPDMFATLQNMTNEDGPAIFQESRDITLKLNYIDGSVKHVVVPYTSFDREPDDYYGLGRGDISYFAVAVPGDIDLCNVELYHRPFVVSFDDDDTEGNINYGPNNITAANYMDGAILKATVNFSCNCPGTPDYIEPGTPCDDGNPLTIDDVEDGFCNCAGVAIGPCGVINNGNFTESTFGWWNWGMEITSVNGEARFSNIDSGDAGIAQGPFSLENNESYKVSFDAYAEASSPLDLLIFLDEEPFTEFYRETIVLETNSQNFERTFTFSNPSSFNVALEFNLSGNESTVFLDNVCLDKACVGGTAEILYNGIDDDCNPGTLDDDIDQDGFLFADDCDDNNININPDAIDIPNNSIDEDCDGFDSIVLPVTFILFEGEVADSEIQLAWEVANEINVSQYVIERSQGQPIEAFIAIGDVSADGGVTYSFTDDAPNEGINYYRIKSVDFDGQIGYSEIIMVNYLSTHTTEDKALHNIILSPSPVNDRIYLSSGELIKIVDLNGREYPLSYDVSQLSSGMYIAIIRVNSEVVVPRKFIKQ